MTVFVGGVGQLYQGDLDFGRHVVHALAGANLGPGVLVEELHYGAVAVAQRLEDLRPTALVLVGAARRGRRPGMLERRPVEGVDAPPEDLQRAVAEAVTGYVTLDLVVEVAFALGVLPRVTVTIELEPVALEVADRLSPAAGARVAEATALVAAEAERALAGVAPEATG